MNTPKTILALLVLALVVVVVIVAAGRGCRPPDPSTGDDRPPSKPSADPVADPDMQKLRDEAYRLQQDKRWCDAAKQWQTVLGQLSAKKDADSELRHEADRNQALCQEYCDRPGGSSGKDVDVPPAANPPEPVTKDVIVAFYPQGKAVRSMALFDAEGDGVNQAWGTKAKRHFAYQYQVFVETEVIDNTETSVVFEQRFKDVSQLRATLELVSLELDPPDSPMFRAAWKSFEEQVLKYIPAYRIGSELAKLGNNLDPNFKRCLTRLAQQLDPQGTRIAPNADVEWAATVDRLSGITVQFTYFSEMGVTRIRQTAGNPLDDDDLRTLARSSSPLIDWFVANVDSRKIGEQFEVHAEDVRAMINTGYDVEVSGSLTLERLPDEADEVRQMKIAAGSVAISSLGTDGARIGNPYAASWGYGGATRRLIVWCRWAKVDWQTSTYYFTKDNLLFGTTIKSGVKLTTYYQAEIVKPK